MGRVKDAMADPADGQIALTDAPEPTPSTDLITMAQITVTQLPIIEERLRDVKAEVERTVADAKAMVATADTIQAVKNRRAELNKQFEALDAQRKAVKKQISAPYDRFNAVYNECIAGPFAEADKALKSTVYAFEGELKKAVTAKLSAYYEELCRVEGIDWLPFNEALNRSGLKIGLADCRTREPKKAMEELALFTSKIGLGLDQVRKMEDAVEVMVEFRKTLDAGAAAATVAERKRKMQEAAEAEERRKAEEAQRREMMERVAAAAPTATQAPTPAPMPPTPAKDPTKFPPCIGFKIYLRSAEEYQKVLPALRELKRILETEGIQYGK